ncbi:hypothetical protein ACWEK5_14875 [Rhodococcus koreensis]
MRAARFAAALLDGFPDITGFTDAAVRRREIRSILDRVSLVAEPVGEGVLDGDCAVVVELDDGRAAEVLELDWISAAALLQRHLPGGADRATAGHPAGASSELAHVRY